jgi:aspartate/methionine/tyrosine aminotransferase
VLPGEPRLEGYYERWGAIAPHRLSASHAASSTLPELLAIGAPEDRERFEKISLGYASTNGDPTLRETIAALYDSVSPEGVLTFAGAQEGIFSTFASLISPGDRVVTFRPCYEFLETIPRALGADVTTVELSAHGGVWRLDLEALEAAAAPGTRLIAVNFPHNPTGADLDEEARARVVEIAAAREAWLFSDEVFRLLADDPAPPIADLYERGISLDVMSKAFGLGGVRVGWIATRAAGVVSAARRAKCVTSICNGTTDEALAILALRAREVLLERNLRIIGENRKAAAALFARHADRFVFEPPRSGCLAFPALTDGTDVSLFADRLAREAGVLALPAGAFLSDENRFRLGLGPAELPEALERLESWLSR